MSRARPWSGAKVMAIRYPYGVLASLVVAAIVSGCASGHVPEFTPAQPPVMPESEAQSTWTRTFAGPDYGAFFDATLAPDGSILAVGATNHLHLPPYSGDALFMNLTQGGDVLWEHTWGGDGYEQAMAVESDQDGGFLILGETDSYGNGDRDFFLLRLTEAGSVEWFRTYGRISRDWPYGMLRLSNQDLLLFGLTEALAGDGRSQYVVRVGPDGDVVWEYVGEGTEEELVLDALETAEGSLVLAVAVAEDAQLVQLAPDGSLRSTKRYDLPGWQFASQIESVSGGGFLLAGFSMSSGSPRQVDTWLARCDSTGELEWDTSFGEPSYDDYATSMIRLRDGTYLIGAIANGMLLSRVDEDGHVLWRRSHLAPDVHGAMALLEFEEGGFLVAGLHQLVNGRSYDAVLLRTDPSGQVSE